MYANVCNINSAGDDVVEVDQEVVMETSMRWINKWQWKLLCHNPHIYHRQY